jgi:type IV pilus assembly protein PilW
MAGFSGCFSTTVEPKNTLAIDPPPVEFNIGQPVNGYEATSTSKWNGLSTLNDLPDDVDEDNVTGGTDVVLIRRAGNDGLRLAAAMQNTSADMKIEANLDPEPIADDDVLLLSDCSKSAIFQVSNYTVASGNIVHNTGGTNPGNSTKILSDGEPFDTDATVYKIETKIFFIQPSDVGTNNRDATYQSLWMKNGTDDPIELVPGIEDLQVLYGEDTGGDGVPDKYVTADDVADMDNVVTIRVTVSATSIDSVGVSGDGILQRDFSSLIKIRNRGV